MRYDLSLVTGFLQSRGHGLRTFPVLLWSDSHTMQRPFISHELTQKCGVSLLAKIRREQGRMKEWYELQREAARLDPRRKGDRSRGGVSRPE